MKEKDDNKTFYITTPIFYPNAKLHMGHAYTTTLSDILARYHRLMGEEVYFLTGSDENAQKMVDAAYKAGKGPLEFLDEIVANFRSLFSTLNISFDQFIRTTDQKVHWPGAQKIWDALVASGDIYKKQYEGFYCVGHEAFVTEKDLVDGICPDHGTAPQFLQEENYFFRLSRYTDQIRDKIISDEFHIAPVTRKREFLSFLDEGLHDVSFSRPRKGDWPQGLGIPVPNDPSQVTNYVTALGYGQKGGQSNESNDGDLYKTFWPGDVHVMGKDILRFHAGIWPAMLLSAGLPLPKTLLVHGFITSQGKKMGKSLGNVIDPEELLSEYGTDAMRCFLARHISPFEDGDITRESFKDAYNADLANGLGNTAARIMQLAQTHLTEGFRPGPVEFPKEYTEALENFEVHKALEYVFAKLTALDHTITETVPFKLVKVDLEAGQKLIYALTQELYLVARLLNPFMPETSEKIKAAIKANVKPETLFPRKE